MENKVEVLISTMYQKKPIDLLKKMNIKSDAIVINQGNYFDYQEINLNNDRQARIYSFQEKGVGLSRNNALMRTKNEYCILADDDMEFKDNYELVIEKLFNDYPNFDVLILNIEEKDNERFIIKKPFKVNYFNFMRFGAARIVFRRKAVVNNGISFYLNFGGGTQHSAGEDVLFLKACLDKKLKILAVPFSIARLLEDRPSTWFEGYNKKFFFDKGVLYATMSRRWAVLNGLQFCIRRHEKFKKDVSMIQAFNWIREGIKVQKLK